MAESIIVHFRNAKPSEVFSFLASRCECVSSDYFYPSMASYVLMIGEYTDYDDEYEPSWKEGLEQILGARPSLSIDIELRRSLQNAACDAAKEIVSELCRVHDLVVDDCFRTWTPEQIANEPDFLAVYRY